MLSFTRRQYSQRKILRHYEHVFGDVECDTLFVPVYANEKIQHGMAAILDVKMQHFLARALQEKRFCGHMTEYLWFIPEDLAGIASVCFFGVGPKEDLNASIFQSIINQVKQQKSLRLTRLPNLGKNCVIGLNFSGKKDHIWEL